MGLLLIFQRFCHLSLVFLIQNILQLLRITSCFQEIMGCKSKSLHAEVGMSNGGFAMSMGHAVSNMIIWVIFFFEMYIIWLCFRTCKDWWKAVTN